MEPVLVAQGQPTKFQVEFFGFPPPVVTWYRYTFPVPNTEDFIVTTDSSSSTLEITKPLLDDSGIFTCVLENLAGATKSSANLSVTETADMMSLASSDVTTAGVASSGAVTTVRSPTEMASASTSQTTESSQYLASSCVQMVSKLKPMSFKVGDTIRFNFLFGQGDKSQLKFYHNGKSIGDTLGDGRQVETSFEGNLATLTVKGATVADSGLYECIMKSEAGEAKCQVQCSITD